MTHTQQASRTQRAGLTLAARACSSGPSTAARWQANPEASAHRGRSYPQVVSTGLCMAVGVCGMSPFHLCTTPPQYHRPRASAPCRQRPAYAATHLGTTSLDTEFWLKIRDNHPISRARPLGHPEAEPPTAATAHSSSPCNLSAVTTRSAERGAARFSPQFCTGSKRICG